MHRLIKSTNINHTLLSKQKILKQLKEDMPSSMRIYKEYQIMNTKKQLYKNIKNSKQN